VLGSRRNESGGGGCRFRADVARRTQRWGSGHVEGAAKPGLTHDPVLRLRFLGAVVAADQHRARCGDRVGTLLTRDQANGPVLHGVRIRGKKSESVTPIVRGEHQWGHAQSKPGLQSSKALRGKNEFQPMAPDDRSVDRRRPHGAFWLGGSALPFLALALVGRLVAGQRGFGNEPALIASKQRKPLQSKSICSSAGSQQRKATASQQHACWELLFALQQGMPKPPGRCWRRKMAREFRQPDPWGTIAV